MKPQILSRHHVPLSIICFLLFASTTLIGCRVFSNVNHVIGRDPVILTKEDLHRMGLGKSNRTRSLDSSKMSPLVIGFERSGSRVRTVQYWLFKSSSAAKRAAEREWVWLFADPGNFHPELNPEDIIGDATWRRIHRKWTEWEKGSTDIYFVKHNLLVYIRTEGQPDYRLQIARDTAREIEAEINTVLEKK